MWRFLSGPFRRCRLKRILAERHRLELIRRMDAATAELEAQLEVAVGSERIQIISDIYTIRISRTLLRIDRGEWARG